MTDSPTPHPDARLQARDRLRSRAVLYEARRPTGQQRRKNPPFCLLPHVADELRDLARHLDENRNFPPNVARTADARIGQLHGMFKVHGPLVLLTFALPALDGHPLHDDTLPDFARVALDDVLWGVVADGAPHTVDIHRGADGGTHAHVVVPLAYVVDDYRDALKGARHGPGGGLQLPYYAAHGVVIGNTARDRQRVAGYVRRHPDGRLWTPGTLDYLHALNDEAQRKRHGQRLPRLGWDGGGARKLGRPHSSSK